MAEFDQELDASGLNCPLPILRAKKALGQLSSLRAVGPLIRAGEGAYGEARRAARLYEPKEMSQMRGEEENKRINEWSEVRQGGFYWKPSLL